jgi:hypothetical protein
MWHIVEDAGTMTLCGRSMIDPLYGKPELRTDNACTRCLRHYLALSAKKK